MSVAIISHPACQLHDMGAWHPERPARVRAIQDQLFASGLDAVVEQLEAPRASLHSLRRVHSARHVEHMLELAERVARGGDASLPIDPDTTFMGHTLEAALRAAGAVTLGVDRVMQGANRAAFCNVRPPGHHAERARAMGFCFFNNLAVAAQYALDEYGLERVAIVDFDVHHGNGTEDIFRDEPRVLLCSSFEHPLFPHSGDLTFSDHILNLPLPAGTAGAQYREQVAARWFQQLDAFAPQLLLISAGFDGHRDDELAQLRLTEADFGWITRELVAIAQRHCPGRIVSALEGGYDLGALGRSVVAHVRELIAPTPML